LGGGALPVIRRNIHILRKPWLGFLSPHHLWDMRLSSFFLLAGFVSITRILPEKLSPAGKLISFVDFGGFIRLILPPYFSLRA
jgi:hypothetical protein